jgi:tetratricopeptide (TPR) repeat protein
MTAHISTKQKIGTFNQEGITRQIEQTLAHFRYLTRRYALFHIIFFTFFLCELIGLLLFLPFLAKSFLLASMVAATFLTVFSYFVLRFYFQTKKPEQFLLLRHSFVQNCQQLLSMNTDMIESRRSFLQSIYHLIHRLEGEEYQYYQILKTLDTLAPLVQKFSVWCHFGDVHLMKELLHTYCLRTQLDWVKAFPTDLELHRSLASAYIALYKLYQLPTEPTYSFIAKEYSNPEMVQKFQKSAQCALEELKIVLHYVPHDTCALSNLANVYHDLDQKEEERKAYEALLQISPHEKDIRFQLGILYFQLGFMAHGLKIYDELRKLNDPKAEELIQQYDLFHSQNMGLGTGK